MQLLIGNCRWQALVLLICFCTRKGHMSCTASMSLYRPVYCLCYGCCACWCQVCPYYLSRDMTATADVIFMPYNYLVDSSVSVACAAGPAGVSAADLAGLFLITLA